MDTKGIKLTDDPLINIGIMVPMLNERGREAVAYFAYGCCVGGAIANKEKKEGENNV